MQHQRSLELIFSRPVSGSVPWRDIKALFQELGGEVSERAGSRVAVDLFGEARVFHRPHPSPDTDKGTVASIRKRTNSLVLKPALPLPEIHYHHEQPRTAKAQSAQRNDPSAGVQGPAAALVTAGTALELHHPPESLQQVVETGGLQADEGLIL